MNESEAMKLRKGKLYLIDFLQRGRQRIGQFDHIRKKHVKYKQTDLLTIYYRVIASTYKTYFITNTSYAISSKGINSIRSIEPVDINDLPLYIDWYKSHYFEDLLNKGVQV